jgi:predicted nucleic acid-binding protein
MTAERVVLDASVAVEWFLPGGGPGQRYAEKMLGRISAGDLLPAVPDLWHYEIGSVLVAAKRDRRMSASVLQSCQATLRGLEFETLALELEAAEVIDLGLRYHLQGYDVVYFELARRLGIPIATVDGGIKTACGVFRVKLL